MILIKVSASLVIYHNKKEQIKKAIYSFINTDVKVKLYLIDNSLNDNLKDLADIDSRIEYIFNGSNLGYGSGHNIAIRKSIEDNVKYHLVLNPDITFENNVLNELIKYMEENKDVGNIMPQILYPDGTTQYLCKLFPSPINLFLRRFIFIKKINDIVNYKYELRFTNYDKIMNVPSLSGCFMLLRNSAIKDVGMFDERFFMFMEDFDLNRRIHEKYKTIFYPDVSVIHSYAKGSYKLNKLFLYHIVSAIKYFNKWGWFFDKERRIINKKTLKDLGYKKPKKNLMKR